VVACVLSSPEMVRSIPLTAEVAERRESVAAPTVSAAAPLISPALAAAPSLITFASFLAPERRASASA